MTLQEQKNLRIKQTYLQTKERRKTQIALTFTFKVHNEKRNKKKGVFNHLKMVFVEGKWIKNSILSQMEKSDRKITSFTQKEFNTVEHMDKDRNMVTDNVTHLGSSMRDSVISQVKDEMRALKARKSKGHKIGKLKYKSDCTAVGLKQYGVTHRIIGNNSYQIQGFNCEIRVAGMRQLRQLEKLGIEYELSSAKLTHCGDNYYIKQTVYVDKEQWMSYKESKKNWNKNEKDGSNLPVYDINALDLGCLKTATDANGKVYNAQVEETERLKKLQKKYNRQLKAAGWDCKKKNRKSVKTSNNMYKTRNLIKREYEKLDNRKNNAAIEVCNEVLRENRTVIIQDENLRGWKKMHGKKVQHGILGRIKARLIASPQVHVINQWVPTTKLCTHCGHIHKEIEEKDREYICPNCKVHDGERDTHSARDMVWLFIHLKERIGLDGAEFKRVDFDEGLRQLFSDSADSTDVSRPSKETDSGEFS